MQVMRIRQRDDRYRNKKKKKQQHGSSSHHQHQSKQLHTEPAYRRKPNPIRRYDTDVLSPVRTSNHTVEWKFLALKQIAQLFKGNSSYYTQGHYTIIRYRQDCPKSYILNAYQYPKNKTDQVPLSDIYHLIKLLYS